MRSFKIKLSAHQLHRWLMLLLAIPISIWALTGSYFVLMDLGYIRSDHIKAAEVDYLAAGGLGYSIKEVYQRYSKAEAISLKVLSQRSYYQLKLKGETLLIDASNGKLVNSLSEQQVIAIARRLQHQQSISPAAKLLQATFISEHPPSELAERHLPVWKIEFDDSVSSTLYISAKSGEVVTRRHDYWRLFDLFWKWHIMDYDDGEAIDNKLLLITALISIIAVVAGLFLVWQRRRRYL